jgi:agmatine/peptidylarginine deiminase
MMIRALLILMQAFALSACVEGTDEAAMPGDSELIILAAPLADDPYYADVYNDIIAFQIEFGRRILAAGDDVIILSDAVGAPLFAGALGEDHVAVYPAEDIWARDFGASNAAAPVFFRYTAAGQGGGAGSQYDADAVQEAVVDLADAAGLGFSTLTMFNDGGNWVDDYAGSVVISRKFLRDNDLSEDEARRVLTALDTVDPAMVINDIAFIEADEQGGLEHADGVVAFIGPGRLIINSYPDDPEYAAALRADLEAGLPGVEIHEVPTPYDASGMYDERFGSACGLYTNALVTPRRIYLPQFGLPEDSRVLEQVRALTDREIIPVSSSGVCRMGGGVRCMSWQLRGENADRLAAYLRNRR